MASGKRAREINATVRYTMWSVFRARIDGGRLPDEGREQVVAEAEDLVGHLAEKDVLVRGTYDIAGMRADADLMVWWHSRSIDDLQEAYSRLRRTRLGRSLEPVWSVSAVHRPAEFNKGHVPAFLDDEEPRRYVSVYPFSRSYEWYLLHAHERKEMLAEHGRMARSFPDVRANTVAAFSLGDYEWILAFEADELHRIVDLMRQLRGASARLHTRVEVPFYTGRRKPLAEIVTALP